LDLFIPLRYWLSLPNYVFQACLEVFIELQKMHKNENETGRLDWFTKKTVKGKKEKIISPHLNFITL
jgi:hypothetical protein